MNRSETPFDIGPFGERDPTPFPLNIQTFKFQQARKSRPHDRFIYGRDEEFRWF